MVDAVKHALRGRRRLRLLTSIDVRMFSRRPSYVAGVRLQMLRACSGTQSWGSIARTPLDALT